MADSVFRVVARPRTHPGRADNTGETRYYLVEFEGPDFTLWDARNAEGIPADGEPLSAGSNLVVTDKNATEHTESPVTAVVEVRWSVPDSGFSIFPPGPTTKKWDFEVSIDGLAFSEPVTSAHRDGFEYPIVNTANDPVDPYPVKDHYDEELVIAYTTRGTYINAIIDDLTASRGKVNSDSVTLNIDGLSRTYAAKTMKLGKASVTRVGATPGTNEKWWRVTLPFVCRADTWTRKIPAMGYNQINADTSVYERITDDQAQEKPQPSYLDADGAELEDGAEVHLMEFDVEDEAPFSPLLTDIA